MLYASFNKDQFFSKQSTKLFCTDFHPVPQSCFTLKIWLLVSNYLICHYSSVKLFPLAFLFRISKEANLLTSLIFEVREEIVKCVDIIDVKSFQGIKDQCFPVSDYLSVRMYSMRKETGCTTEVKSWRRHEGKA